MTDFKNNLGYYIGTYRNNVLEKCLFKQENEFGDAFCPGSWVSATQSYEYNQLFQVWT